MESTVDVQSAGRSLTGLERSVISHLLSVPFEGAQELRGQLESARAVSDWKPEGSPSFDIWVPDDATPAPMNLEIAPVGARVFGEDGAYQGELILWISGGKLSGLEYSWVTDEAPMKLPEVSMIRVSGQ